MADWQTGEQPKREGRYLVRYSYRTPWTGVVISTEKRLNGRKTSSGISIGVFVMIEVMDMWRTRQSWHGRNWNEVTLWQNYEQVNLRRKWANI